MFDRFMMFMHFDWLNGFVLLNFFCRYEIAGCLNIKMIRGINCFLIFLRMRELSMSGFDLFGL